MHTCSIHKELEIVPGDLHDYDRLAVYHYRQVRPAAVKAVYTIRPRRSRAGPACDPAAVVVYALPGPRVELRNVATQGVFRGLDRQTELELLNRCLRCLARVVVAPRFRGIGLAVRLIRATLPKLQVPLVEALAVMPRMNPFLERAGFRAFAPRVPVAHVELLEAFSLVGIEEDNLVDPALVQQRLERLPPSAGEFLELHLQRFLKSHGRRRTMGPGLARTQYVLARLTYRPAYYLWVNPSHLSDSGVPICACGGKKVLASNPPSEIRNPESLRRSL